MDSKDKLNKEFFSQDFSEGQPYYAEMLNEYRVMAYNYARLENAIAVLSDLRTNVSYVYYGKFSRVLGMEEGIECKISSIWEEDIFQLLYPDDLAEKHLHELCFFHFIKRQPKERRADYYLMSKFRMRTKTTSYIPVWHRMFYISVPSNETLWLALCLYSPLLFEIPDKCLVVNSVNGQTFELGESLDSQILSSREKQILSLVDKGMTSKDIANIFSISINTVSRHRQEILNKLQVRNSIEACRIAKKLGII